MPTLVTLAFQGQPSVEGKLRRDDVDTLRREAFPRSPAPDALGDPDWRAYKLVPLPSGRLALSVARDLGDDDEFGRPVLRATACVVEPRDLVGAWRDPVAVWRAIEDLGSLADAASLDAEVQRHSALAGDQAFERLAGLYRSHGELYARAAAALGQPEVDLFLPRGAAAATRLRPALLLLPLARLVRLHLSTGSSPGHDREDALGVEGRPRTPAPPPSPGLIGRLLHREPPPSDRTVQVDLVDGAVRGAPGRGPLHLARVAADAEPWPGLSPRARFALLLACLDGPTAGQGQLTPFEAVPELAAMRRVVGQAEAVTHELEAWR